MKQFVIIFLVILIGFAFGQEQDEYQEDFQKIKSRYHYTITRPSVVDFNYFLDFSGAEQEPEFHLAVSIQNDFLQFNREGNKFISRYDVLLLIRKKDETWFSKSWQESAELSDFDRTNSKRDYQYHEYSMNFIKENNKDITSGEYEIFLEIQDKLSSREYKNKRKWNYTAWSDTTEFKHTEIAFSPMFQSDSTQSMPISATRNILDINEPYVAFASVYGTANKKLSANIRLYKKSREESDLLDRGFYEADGDMYGKYVIKYNLPYKKMGEGKYILRFSVSDDDSIHEIEREFSILWYLKPLYLFKVDLAVRPLKYLLTPEEMDKVKEMNMHDLQVWFDDFWKKKDPNPETVFNELQDVYYKRVTEAVRLYSTRFLEGWQTDQGMVYLLYGEPSEVENRTYSVDSVPHIIWKYNYDGNVREFIFVDKTKSGEFVLINNDEEQDKQNE